MNQRLLLSFHYLLWEKQKQSLPRAEGSRDARTSHSIFTGQHLRAGVCVPVCVARAMCVEGSSFAGKCLNQTSGRDDKSALWFGPQRPAVGSKRSTTLHCAGFSGPSLTTTISCWGPAREHAYPHCVWHTSRWWRRILSCGEATWWSHPPWELGRYLEGSLLHKIPGPLGYHLRFSSHHFNES